MINAIATYVTPIKGTIVPVTLMILFPPPKRQYAVRIARRAPMITGVVELFSVFSGPVRCNMPDLHRNGLQGRSVYKSEPVYFQ